MFCDIAVIHSISCWTFHDKDSNSPACAFLLFAFIIHLYPLMLMISFFCSFVSVISDMSIFAASSIDSRFLFLLLHSWWLLFGIHSISPPFLPFSSFLLLGVSVWIEFYFLVHFMFGPCWAILLVAGLIGCLACFPFVVLVCYLAWS